MSEDLPQDARQRLERARTALDAVQARVGTDRRWDAPTLPLTPLLAPVLPGGLRRGQVIAVEGSTSLMLELVSAASRQGSWTAVVGMPTLGVVAAVRRGIDLDRMALIPHPGAQAAAVVGTCVEGMDAVLVGAGLALSDADRRRIAARAKERGSVIVAAGSWLGAHATLRVTDSHWVGLGSGEGRLREHRVAVAVEGRSRGPMRPVEVVLDTDAGARWVRPDPHVVRSQTTRTAEGAT